MSSNAFKQPVEVFIGWGNLEKIASVEEAFKFLVDCRPGTVDATYRIAMNACKASLAGDVDPETVRCMLVAFARKHDLLAPGIGGLVARRPGRGSEPRVT